MFIYFSFAFVPNRGILTKIRLEDIHDTWVSDGREYWPQHLSSIPYKGKEFECIGQFFFQIPLMLELARIEFYDSRYWC